MSPMEPGQHICPVCGHDNSIRQNTENTLPEGTILAGKYLVGRKLGQGGFGITYLGFDLALTVKVAIKEYFPAGVGMRAADSIRVAPVSSLQEQDGFQKGCQEFQTEARTLAQFNSPNIIHVRDYFRENGTAYIVMDFVEGNSLTKEVMLCGGRMPWERVLDLFKPLILELEKLHEEHLIHRDIKPDNIYLTKDKKGRQERLILLDFGSARRFVSEQITKTYSALVTPGYAPMEQYSQKSRQGPYTDVYSLCATMYALITGQIPASATDVMMGIDSLRSIRSMGIEIPDGIEKAILHGLEMKSENRPQTMDELYDELTNTVGSQVQVQPQIQYAPPVTPTMQPPVQYSPETKIKTGDFIRFGKYPQSKNNNLPESIEWKVLTVNNKIALIISSYGLDVKKYNETFIDVTWETSSLRKWLNKDFYDIAFTDSEKQQIFPVMNDNPNNPKFGTNGGDQTHDRIFLLSIDEAIKYFQSDEQRKCIATRFAKADGAAISSNLGTSWWWLRTPGGKNDAASYIYDDGIISMIGIYVTREKGVVRPALWLKL